MQYDKLIKLIKIAQQNKLGLIFYFDFQATWDLSLSGGSIYEWSELISLHEKVKISNQHQVFPIRMSLGKEEGFEFDTFNDFLQNVQSQTISLEDLEVIDRLIGNHWGEPCPNIEDYFRALAHLMRDEGQIPEILNTYL